MSWKAVVAIGSFILATFLGILLTIHNHKNLVKTRAERVRARRAAKRIKNMKLAKFFGIDYKPKE